MVTLFFMPEYDQLNSYCYFARVTQNRVNVLLAIFKTWSKGLLAKQYECTYFPLTLWRGLTTYALCVSSGQRSSFRGSGEVGCLKVGSSLGGKVAMTSYQSGLSISFITPALIRSRTLKKKTITIYLGRTRSRLSV